MLVAVVAGPATASHEETGGPIIPWHHDGETLTFSAGDVPPIGARWGTCNRGLAQAAISNAEFTLTVNGEPVDIKPTATKPFTGVEMIDFNWDEGCIPKAHGEKGWWVFWTYDTVDLSAPGTYEVHLEFDFSDEMTDGGDVNPVDGEPDTYGPGLVAEGTVTIIIVET